MTIHAGEKKYVPEMLFGELLTGSSFDDTETKVTGGRNGLGTLSCLLARSAHCVRCEVGEYLFDKVRH